MRFIEKLNKYYCQRFMSFRPTAVQALNANILAATPLFTVHKHKSLAVIKAVNAVE